MELKLKKHPHSALCLSLLIELYGIEILLANILSTPSLLLIELYGIEIEMRDAVLLSLVYLLIELYGIEMCFLLLPVLPVLPFNRTIWN